MGQWGDTSPSGLPQASAPMVPRDRELGLLTQYLLRPQPRLVTLVGAPGAGKTQLALMAAESVSEYFAAGVWFIDLLSARDAAQVSQTIASGVGIVDATGGDIDETLGR